VTVFKKYSEYYNLIYKDKNYKNEVDYIDSLIKSYSKNGCNPIELLDLGCGTGTHLSYFSNLYYKCLGIDKAADMIKIAQESYPQLDFACHDIQDIRFQKKFTAIVSLFHVISYQTTNIELFETFKNVYEHLKDGGIFIFDFWYGPAVLNEKPEKRIKEFKNNELQIKRKCQPSVYLDKNVVNVHYDIEVYDIKSGKVSTFSEDHKMRYFFYPEIEFMLEMIGFKEINAFDWMTKNTLYGWNGVLVVTK
tara:strand:+ start:2666 stop:3412 length:747 start_codon:yes stop_codon:yes gene_type:complete